MERQQLALKAHTQALDLKKSVTLVPKRGPPEYFRWITDENNGKILSTEDGVFSIQNWGYGLVELLPDPRLERYRFCAEVRHENQATISSKVGIYFAESHHPDGQSVPIFHCVVAYNDLFDMGPKDEKGIPNNCVWPEAHRQLPAGLANRDTVKATNAGILFRPAKAWGGEGPWRQIEIEVRPETMKISWKDDLGERKNASIQRTTLMQKTGMWNSKETPVLFPPRGGLGLYVSLGVASFRNVIVESLDDEN